jgi:hypothetical protein
MPVQTQEEAELSLQLICSVSAVASITPGLFYPRERAPVPILWEAGWALGTSLDRHDISHPPPGFYPCTIQPVAGRCTDCTIHAALIYKG